MKKYHVSIECVDYYQELEIEAQDKNEAEEKYQTMLENGDVLVVKSDFQNLEVGEVFNK